MSQPAGFPLNEGDSVTYLTANGFQTGYFVRWNRQGAAVIRKPAGGHANIAPSLLRPCNDGRMVRLRGVIPWPGSGEPAPTTALRRKR
jgi:hypothetical protein